MPFFIKNEDPLQIERWIDQLEQTYEICGYTEEQKGLCVGYLFQGLATQWWTLKWKLLKSELGSLVAVSWECFKKEFYDRYFLSSRGKLKAREFVNLVQGNMTVELYA